MKKLLPFSISIIIVIASLIAFYSFDHRPYAQTNTSWTTTSAIGIGTASPDKYLTINSPDWDWASSTHNSKFIMTSSYDNEVELNFQGFGSAVILDSRPTVPTFDFGTGTRAIFRKGIWTNTATNADTALYNQYGSMLLSMGTGATTRVGMADDGSGYKLQAASISYQNFRTSTASTSGYVLTVGSDGHTITPKVANGGGSTLPGGSNTQIQFNNSGSFDGNSDMAYNSAAHEAQFTHVKCSSGNVGPPAVCSGCQLGTNITSVTISSGSSDMAMKVTVVTSGAVTGGTVCTITNQFSWATGTEPLYTVTPYDLNTSQAVSKLWANGSSANFGWGFAAAAAGTYTFIIKVDE